MGDIDPEVLADLELRERSARERAVVPVTRLKWEPATVIGKVPCRNRCGNVVDWNDAAQERFDVFNAVLERRNEAPLDKTRIVFCPACIERGKLERGWNNWEARDKLAEVIRAIKASNNPDGEIALIARAKKLGHPDTDALLAAIKTKRETKAGSRRAKADDL